MAERERTSYLSMAARDWFLGSIHHSNLGTLFGLLLCPLEVSMKLSDTLNVDQPVIKEMRRQSMQRHCTRPTSSYTVDLDNVKSEK
jgi:hypothetical protein